MLKRLYLLIGRKSPGEKKGFCIGDASKEMLARDFMILVKVKDQAILGWVVGGIRARFN